MTWKVLVMMAVCVYGTANAEVPEYSVRRTTGSIVLDGILDEADWARAEPVGEFVFPWWTEGEKEQTEVKMLWDDNFLYAAFTCRDKHIWAEHYNTNSATYQDDCVELFWNPNPDAGAMYNMFEINCIGTLLSVYNNFERPFSDRESRIMIPRIARRIHGTVNNDNDCDTGWTLEIAVRFADYPELSARERPRPGDVWRVGLNRCGGKTNPQYSQWSPTQADRPNFHRPEDFGRIVFSELPAGTGTLVEEGSGTKVPGTVMLYRNFPNPFNASTSIRFALLEDGYVTLTIYSIAEQRVRTLVSGPMTAGLHTVTWDGRDNAGNRVSSGIYLTHLRMGDRSATGRMVLMK